MCTLFRQVEFFSGSILILFYLIVCLPETVEAQAAQYAYSWQIQCVNSIAGCPCYKKDSRDANAVRVFHMQAATPEPDAAVQGLMKIQVAGLKCWYPAQKLKKYSYAAILQSSWQKRLDHTPLSLKKLLGVSSAPAKLKKFRREFSGLYWPTYYHLALEDFHPGVRGPILDRKGKRLGTSSQAFLKQVMWEGSGISRTGLRLHYTGKKMRFELYPAKLWGYGAGYGHRVWPYRTIALNFPALCRALDLKRCTKKKVIGTLVWIKEVASRNIRMSDGSVHDGFFCATDTGSPNYIKRDRIDIFVGIHGGGNPYLPALRRSNLLYDAGLKSLVPHDWRLWRSARSRVWCDWSRLPGRVARARACTHDYHSTARHKALQLFVFKNKSGLPLRCKPGFGN